MFNVFWADDPDWFLFTKCIFGMVESTSVPCHQSSLSKDGLPSRWMVSDARKDWDVPSGKRLHNYGKSMKITIFNG